MPITDKQIEAALSAFWGEQPFDERNRADMTRALEAADAAAWQPIETAKKDGTKILARAPVFNGVATLIAKYDADLYAVRPRPFWTFEGTKVSDARKWQPTH